MPTVPPYGPRKVEPTPLPGARQTGPAGAAETPESQGAQIGGALADLGATGERAALQAREGQHDVKVRAEQRANQIFELTASRKFNEAYEHVLTDPERGVLNARGLGVMQATKGGFEDWERAVADIKGSALNDDQALIAEGMSVQYGARLTERLHTHQIEQMSEYDEGERKGFQASAERFAAANVLHDPVAVTEQILAVDAQTAKYAERNGLGPEASAALRAEARNRVAVQAITGALTGDNPQLAQRLLEHYTGADDPDPDRDHAQDILTGPERARMEEAVKRGVTDGAGEELASRIWNELGPKSDTDAISLDQMETKAREKAGKDTELLKAAISALRTRKQGVDDGRRERLNTVQTALWGGVMAGRSYSEISHLPEAVNNPIMLREVRDYLEGRATAAENREYNAGVRANAEQSRREQELEKEGYAEYFRLTQTDELRKLTPGAIQAKLKTLGHTLTQRLLNEFEQRTKSDATLSAAEMDRSLFLEQAAGSGYAFAFTSPGSQTQDQRALLGQLYAAANQEIARRGLAKGSALTREETVAAYQSVIDQKVMIDKIGWDREAVAATVKQNERGQAYVPFDSITKIAAEPRIEGNPSGWTIIKTALNQIRLNNPAFAKLSDEELRARPGVDRAIERSYAAVRMGLKIEEQLAPLREVR